jgi:hypothetical protein
LGIQWKEEWFKSAGGYHGATHLKILAEKKRIFQHNGITVGIGIGIAIAVAIAIENSA